MAFGSYRTSRTLRGRHNGAPPALAVAAVVVVAFGAMASLFGPSLVATREVPEEVVLAEGRTTDVGGVAAGEPPSDGADANVLGQRLERKEAAPTGHGDGDEVVEPTDGASVERRPEPGESERIASGGPAGVGSEDATPNDTPEESSDGAVSGAKPEPASVGSVAATSTTKAPPTSAAPPTSSPSSPNDLAAPASLEQRPVQTASQPTPRAAPRSVPEAVLAGISYPWRELLAGWRIEFLGPRRGLRGSAHPDERVIRIYQRPDLSVDDLIHVLAHEIGHALDVEWLSDADRAAWLALRGVASDTTWWVTSGTSDFASGAGDWAEVFAFAQHPAGGFYSRLAPAPDLAQLAAMDTILANAFQRR